MRLLHDPPKISAPFDEPNLVSRAGLVPVLGLAERAGLVGRHVRISAKTGVAADVKVGCLVAGMAAGADSVDDMDVPRHGAMSELFDGIRAPSTLGSFLRSFTWGNVGQLEKVSRLLLAGLARRAPLLPCAGQIAFVDVDSTQRHDPGLVVALVADVPAVLGVRAGCRPRSRRGRVQAADQHHLALDLGVPEPPRSRSALSRPPPA